VDTVRVVGTGLLGTSIALGLRSRAGAPVRVLLADPSPTALALARDLGAGEVDPGGVEPDLVVVATPPDVAGRVVLDELAAYPRATVTDVASVKASVLDVVITGGGDAARYVGGHPMSGRERSGAVAARGDLFLGRPWVICPTPKSETARVEAVRALATGLGAAAVTMSPAEHDEAVALVSHVPQLAASLVAARLCEAPEEAVAIAGQGVRDVTRIARSDPTLWAQILAGNAAPVADVLHTLREDLDAVLTALDALAAERPGRTAEGARATVARTVAAGNAGRDRLPGKHGARPTAYSVLTVVIPDEPGSLARLFHDIGDFGVNIEELALEHAPGRAVGLLELSVLPAVREHLEASLASRGWQVAG
jgi:prephenate dehydrogenase